MNPEFQNIVDYINQIIEEKTTSKGVREKLKDLVVLLSSEEDEEVAISRAQSVLEEFESDPNIDSYTRQQLYGIVSVLSQFE